MAFTRSAVRSRLAPPDFPQRRVLSEIGGSSEAEFGTSDHQPKNAEHSGEGGNAEHDPSAEQRAVRGRKRRTGLRGIGGQIAHAHLQPHDR